MTDLLDWAINLPTIFLPIAESIITFFNTPILEVLNVLTGQQNGTLGNIINKIIQFALEQFGLNITVFDALLGGGLIIILTLTLAKWIIGIIQ